MWSSLSHKRIKQKFAEHKLYTAKPILSVTAWNALSVHMSLKLIQHQMEKSAEISKWDNSGSWFTITDDHDGEVCPNKNKLNQTAPTLDQRQIKKTVSAQMLSLET